MKIPVFVVALIVATLWGVAPVVHRYMLTRHEPPYYLILLISSTVYMVSIVSWVICTRSLETVKADFKKLGNMNIAILALTSFFALFIANILYLYATKHASQLALVNVLFSLYPILTMLLAWLVLRESVSWKFLVGFGLVMVGVWIMVTSRTPSIT
jgi:drug/metabolite transporter (DMT)-like permease